MPTSKILFSIFLGMAVVFAQVGIVQAAPPQQDGALITGTIQSVVVEPGFESDHPTVVITLLVNGETKISRTDLDTAVSLGLIVLDEEWNPVVDTSKFGADIQVDPDTFALDETPMPEDVQHPGGAKIAEFFSGFFTVDYELVMSSHSNGFGFGVISQALWMTEKLGGDATLFQTILDAKKSNDYAGVVLPDGTVPQNWGQLKKALLQDDVDENPGDIVSGDAGEQGNQGNGKPEDPGNGTPANHGMPASTNNGNGKPETPGNGNGKPDNPGNSNNNPGNGVTNRPETPPGQDKDKNKDNNGNGKTK